MKRSHIINDCDRDGRTDAASDMVGDMAVRRARAGLRVVCSDMWRPYFECLGQEGRRSGPRARPLPHHGQDEQSDRRDPRQGGQGLSSGLDPHTLAAYQAPGDLTAKQEPRLAELLQYNLCSVRAYLLKEDFQFFWSDKSPYWAVVFLDRSCTRTLGSRIGPMKKFARTLRGHRALLLNWFRAKRHFSSGTVAGFNNKARLTMRKSYGFRTYKAAEIAYIIYLTLYTNPSSPTDSAEEASFWKLRQNTLPFFIGRRAEFVQIHMRQEG